MKNLLVATGLVLSVSACATPEVVNVHKSGDESLSCAQLSQQFVEAQQFEKKAHREKGATGTNVAAVVFFWPALLATYSNIEDAVEAAQDRQTHLKNLAAKKGCVI